MSRVLGLHAHSFQAFLLIEFLVILGVMICGAFLFSYFEQWRWFDSLYFVVITMATIGYGDFVPQTDPGKFMSMIYAMMGVPLFVYITSMMIDYRFQKYIQHYQEHKHSSHGSWLTRWKLPFGSRSGASTPTTGKSSRDSKDNT